MGSALKTAKNAYRTLLLKKRTELLASTKGAPAALATNVQSPDVVEFAVRTAEQDVTAVTASLRSQLLREVDNALGRCARGTYGACEGCHEEIAPPRLKAVPWTRYCLTCQELRSRN
jgi:DnaK suppressor protein